MDDRLPLSAATEVALRLQRDIEREVYYGFNLGCELVEMAINDPETFATLQRVVTVIREKRVARDSELEMPEFCATCDNAGVRSDHAPDTMGRHGAAAREYIDATREGGNYR